MHTKAFASGAGVKKIQTPANAGAAQTLSSHTLNALVHLLKKQGISGITLWMEEDKEVEQVVYHLEAGNRQYLSNDIRNCILNASGEMPTKKCSKCTREKPLDLFPHNRLTFDGRGNYCNLCNRRTGSRRKVPA